MFPKFVYDNSEFKYNLYRGSDCIEKLCANLKERVSEAINYERKEMLPMLHIKRKIPVQKWNFQKVRDSSHFTGRYMYTACRCCCLIKAVPRENPMVMYNRSSYDYQFVIKQKGN